MRALIKAVTEWARDLIVICLTFAFIEMLLPAGDLRRFAKVVIGITIIAVIIGSVVDITTALDEALEVGARFPVAETGPPDGAGWIAKGELIALTGLRILEDEAKATIAREVESVARLASGARKACAEVEFTSQGNLRRIHIALEGLSTAALGISGSDSSLSEDGTTPDRNLTVRSIEERTKQAVEDHYRFGSGVAISVSVNSCR